MLEKKINYNEHYPYFKATLIIEVSLYFVWGFFVNFFFPQYTDPMWVRGAFLVFFVSIALLSSKHVWLEKRKHNVMFLFLYAAALHLTILSHVNQDTILFDTALILGVVFASNMTYDVKGVLLWSLFASIIPTYGMMTNFSTNRLIFAAYMITAIIVSVIICINRRSLLYTLIEKNRELKEQKAMAVQVSKLSAIGEIASGVAHELNNPLTIINGNADRLKKYNERSLNNDKEVDKSLDKIKDAVKRSVSIIKSLRSFSRDTINDEAEILPVKEIVQEAIQLAESRISSEGIPLDIIHDNNFDKVKVNKVEITQILLNLINNSYDAISDLEEKWIRIEVTNRQGVSKVSVIDSGDGIEAEVVEKMMGPFFTTKPPGVGTGLGLSVSRNIAEKFEGSLSYDVNSPKTKFDLTLPIA
ncbi:ATP-binding protein [Halobacteriovorax sp. GB3]|uniref:sensor histidine kinase n=1 Tax=Halobacteriovorax sp. GB3 TaxID=2719615 RepID=UPI002362CC65|nr:ATP-binding protein [Halobacteriovorax sp. GB3]MDD0852576.1 ATP-binding protein [Halobacteriovorax sp. GB3]